MTLFITVEKSWKQRKHILSPFPEGRRSKKRESSISSHWRQSIICATDWRKQSNESNFPPPRCSKLFSQKSSAFCSLTTIGSILLNNHASDKKEATWWWLMMTFRRRKCCSSKCFRRDEQWTKMHSNSKQVGSFTLRWYLQGCWIIRRKHCHRQEWMMWESWSASRPQTITIVGHFLLLNITIEALPLTTALIAYGPLAPWLLLKYPLPMMRRPI